MELDTHPLLAAALAAALVLSGCVGTQGDSELSANSAGNAPVKVTIEAKEPGEVSHLGLELDRVLAHDANVSLPDGFHALSLEASHADLVSDGEAAQVTLAAGSVPEGGYDQVLLRLANATVEAKTSGDGGGHGHGSGDGHAHAHGNQSSGNASADASKAVHSGSIDLPLNASFEATPADTTELTFVLNVADSFDGDSFSPSFEKVEVERGNETVGTQTNLETRSSPNTDMPSDPPAARVAVYAPNGDQIYKPPFDPEDGVFVNSKTSAFSPGDTLRFGGTDSEAVAKGAAIESYEWSFGDGATASGQTASHAYDQQGVYEVELEITDSYGNAATHTVRVVVLQTEWTTKLVETSFENGEGDWTTASAGSAPSQEAETTWALDGSGNGSASAWHVGHHTAHPRDEGAPPAVVSSYPGYTANAEATLTSPAFTIPENWTSAGYSFQVAGGAESCCDPLSITYTVGENSTTNVATVGTTDGWTEFKEIEGLASATGKDVQFTFTFTSDALQQQGPGFYVDDFTIGGVDEPLKNAHLLEESGGGHGGHDHSH